MGRAMTGQVFTVTLQPAGVRVPADGRECIVDELRRAGIRSPYKCRRGGCGACKARLVSGTVAYSAAVSESVLSRAEQDTGYCLPCRAVPTSDVVVDIGPGPVRGLLAATSRRPAVTSPTNPDQEESKPCQSSDSATCTCA